ncbi:amidohydrolase family protein [candidate division KSB3 bacterium]|uniref:Amidohydrolase family protein n=1 Tax=candidate division KSB3 bacterium TaxID=2044937 RepID=A0A9D5JUF3_9BACT|nr:amidohydrolase family protein [candidate division KSB3 bacterium]MBD3324201.1 amidohydrolase family protein [candidate division KSB3 bacterium]
MIDMLITNGIVITMDPERRVIEDGAVAIQGDRIAAVGTTNELTAQYHAENVIDASRMVVMPGLIDGHAHAGHGLVKTMGGPRGDLWFQACDNIYAEGSTEEFWYAEALLSALERVKCGTTCGVSLLGGGPDLMRVDEPAYGDRHCEAIQEVGIRSFLAVGPCRPPFPHKYTRWHGQSRRDLMVSFEDLLATSETLIQRWHRKHHRQINLCAYFPVYHPDRVGSELRVEDLQAQARAIRELSHQYGVLLTQDGHTRGTITFTHDVLNLLELEAFMSHSIDLTAEEIEICRETDTRIVHNPSAIMSIKGRCPVPELLDAGVTVMLGSDGTAPDRSYDMFRHMFQCMHYHRTYYHDPSYLPPGKVLEMVTIDAARALGLEQEIGSLEPGKQADMILVDMFKPHLYPLNMPVFRIAHFANGSDVDTVIVAGKVLMEHREVKTVNEAEILNMAQRETEAMLERTDLRGLLQTPDRFWGYSRY